MFNLRDDLGVSPSFYLVEITAVNTEHHTCTVALLRGMDSYDDVLILRDPGNFTLPIVGDVGAIIWDNKNRPILIGTYPSYHKADLDEHKNYNVQAGERIIQSEFGQKLLMNKGGKILLSNALDEGIEIDEKTGILFNRTNDTIIEEASGLTKRAGVTKRKSLASANYSSIESTTGGTIADVGTSLAGIKNLIETAAILSEEGTGKKIYESKIANIVVEEGTTSAAETIAIPKHSDSGECLRAKTVYYITDDDGVIIEIDIYGNTKVSFPSTISTVILEDLGNIAEFILRFMTITLEGTDVTIEGSNSVTLDSPEIKVDGSDVKLGDLASAVKALVISDVLQILTDHQHIFTGTVSGSTCSGTTNTSLTLVDLPSGTYETSAIKGN